MVKQEKRDRIKKDFFKQYLDGKPLSTHLRGLGFSQRGNNLTIEVRLDVKTQDDSTLPQTYTHKTGNYPVNVAYIGVVKPLPL